MKGEKYFLYVGNAYPHKNLSRMVEAIILLNKRNDQTIKLKIVSSRNEFTQKLEKLVIALKASKFVELLGYVEDTKLDLLYKNSLAFVYPSISEGFGLQGLEAMRNETLLCASDIQIFREIYEDNATYFNPFDFTSIENAMEKVIETNENERNAKIKKAKEFVKKYSWRKMAEETLKIYESLKY